MAHTARTTRASPTGSPRRAGTPDEDFPPRLDLSLDLKEVLRYGENPHQRAALYTERASAPNLVGARQLNGKELSYNNLLDLDRRWRSCAGWPGRQPWSSSTITLAGPRSRAIERRHAAALAGDR